MESTAGRSSTPDPQGPILLPGSGWSPCSQRGPVSHIASFWQPLQFAVQGSGVTRGVARPLLYIFKEFLAPLALRPRVQGSGFQGGLRGRSADSPLRGAGGPFTALSVHQASPVPFRASGSGMPPRPP
ncbi:hypothetical protein NDU88_006272 [Pleurodeles waltl]|uniref:Uncharacterized protein n=1 Tax=Pleurodeles waltl TaxID=8319 RepID=A0AAV7TXY7_PLEWA|nr:hypothetical protein NDU88_006272 [Pleurodeles waltl]